MLVVLLVLLAAAGAQASAEQTVLCGRELAKAHSLYCYGIDTFPDEAFHSDLFSSPKTDPDFGSLKIPERFAFRARRTAAGAGAAAARLSSAIVETCCLKPCYVSELLNHC